MCSSARFGARTGGALVILGAVLLVTAIFFSSSVGTFLRLFPPSILGVILFLLTGGQLALGGCDVSNDKGERFVTMITGALAVWNVGIAFIVGIAAYWLNKPGLLRL
jgi:hypothetical protein